MQRYQSHKIVEAGIIGDITMPGADGSRPQEEQMGAIHLMDGESVPIDGRFVARHCPPPFNLQDADTEKRMRRLIGSYLVQYTNVDGSKYLSVCPADEFEAGNMPIATLPDGDSVHAIMALRKGLKVARRGWNGKGMWLDLQRPDEHSKMTLPYVYLNYPECERYPQGARVPWMASQTDMLAEDWYLVE